MSFLGDDSRNSIAIGVGGMMSLFSGRADEQAQSNLLCENSDNLIQEDGGLILLE